MKNKPLIFTLLSALCFIEPLIKVLYFKATTHFDFVVILTNLLARDRFKEVIDFWLIFPVAGLLILKLRKWTYFSFLAVLLYINYSMFTYEKYTWPYNSDSPFMYNFVVTFLSFSLFGYFLFPKTREPFFDKRIRWWEPKTRYDVFISCKLQGENLTFPGTVLNISQSGAFVQESKYMKVGDTLQVEFHFLGEVISLPALVVNKHQRNEQTGFGLKFQFRTLKQTVQMSKVMKILKKSRIEFSENTSAA